MKKCYLDTNFLVYLKNEDSPLHSGAVNQLEKLIRAGIDLYLSPLTLDEFLHSFGYELKKKSNKNYFSDLKIALEYILDLPTLVIINPPTEKDQQKQVVSLMENYSLHPRDAYHLLIMKANNIDGFATFDSDFKKVFLAKILTKA